MKMTTQHFTTLKRSIDKVIADNPSIRYDYIAGDFPRADLVNDLDKRFRWDMFHFSKRYWSGLTVNDLYEYINDVNIDTALRRIVPPLKDTGL